MGAAKISDPSALMRSLVSRQPRGDFQRQVFAWVERVSGSGPADLWLLDTGRENLGRFVGFEPGLFLDEDLIALFQSPEGTWTRKLSSREELASHQAQSLFAVPFFGERNQSLGLITFLTPPKGAAWLRLIGLIIELYLSRLEQANERRTLETLLKQAKEKLKESAQAADQGFFLRRRQGSLKELRNQFERMLILDRLSIPHQSKSEVATSLGITYRSLASKCKSLDI